MSPLRRFASLSTRTRRSRAALSLGSLRSYSDIPENPSWKANTVINVCHQGKVTVLERFGKFSHVKNPGIFFALPFIDTLWTVDLREHVINITPQGAITKDNVRIEICGCLYVRFVDPFKALYGARKPLFAAKQQAQSVMRSAVGKLDMDEIFHKRSELNLAVREGIQNATTAWGLEVHRYEVTDIIPDPEIAKAMDKQAAAERQRREKVKNSIGEKESKVLLSEAQKIQDINESEGIKIRMTNTAAGKAQEVLMEAEAQAKAVEVIAKILDEKGENGRLALQYDLAKQYIQYMQKLGESPSTVFLNQNVGDISSMVATGVSALRALERTNVEPPKKDPPNTPEPSKNPPPPDSY